MPILGLQRKGVFLSFLKMCLPPPNRASKPNHSPHPRSPTTTYRQPGQRTQNYLNTVP